MLYLWAIAKTRRILGRLRLLLHIACLATGILPLQLGREVRPSSGKGGDVYTWIRIGKRLPVTLRGRTDADIVKAEGCVAGRLILVSGPV